MSAHPSRQSWLGNLRVIALVASRFARRDEPPRRRLWLLVASVAAVVVSASLAAAGVSHLAIMGVLLVSSLMALVLIALHWFPPPVAVSIVGVALSCASLMTAFSVTTGFERAITESMARMNGHILLTKYGLDFFEYPELSEQWTADPRVVSASPFAYSMAAMVKPTAAEALEAAQSEDIVTPSVVVIKGLDPERARHQKGLAEMFGRGDLSSLRPGDTKHLPGIALGDTLARRLGVDAGDEVRVVVPAELDGRAESIDREPRHATFEVLDTFTTGSSEYDRNFALTHLTAAQALFFREGRVTGIEYQLRDPDDAPDVAEDMEAALPDFYRPSAWQETQSEMLITLRQIRGALAIILGLMAVVAAFSLVASLMLIIRRKRPDIGVLLAIGSSPNLAFWMFESLGLFIGGLGALAGLALGALYCFVIALYRLPLESDIYPVDFLPVIVRPIDALGPAVAAVVLCGLASGPVAMLAARTRILSAMSR